MTATDRYLTVGELCDRWHVDTRTLQKLIEAGGLSVFTLEPLRVRRFSLLVVLAYEQKHFQHGSTESRIS